MIDALQATGHNQEIEVTRDELPLYCPRNHDAAWSMHPRVFLEIEHAPDHRVTCPYCGAKYVLKD